MTATKRETTLQDVPVAVTVTSGETMAQAQIIDISDLQHRYRHCALLNCSHQATPTSLFADLVTAPNNPGIEPSVGVFIDGVYRSRSSGAISDLTILSVSKFCVARRAHCW